VEQNYVTVTMYSRFLRVSCEDEMWYQCIISTARLFRAALIALCGLIVFVIENYSGFYFLTESFLFSDICPALRLRL